MSTPDQPISGSAGHHAVDAFLPNREEDYTVQVHLATKWGSRYRRAANALSTIRLIVFILLALSIWWCIRQQDIKLLWISAGLLVLFLFSINRQVHCKQIYRLNEQLLFLATNELQVLAGGPNGFPDGAEFLDHDNYLDDLDIFGKRSLYHLLNRTTTLAGARALASVLRHPCSDPVEIVSRQEAVAALARQQVDRQQIMAAGRLAEKIEPPELDSWLHTPPRLQKPVLRFAIRLLTLYNLFSTGYYLYSNNSAPLLFGVVISWGLTGYFTRYIGEQHQQISRKQALLDQYAGILGAFGRITPFSSTLLEKLKDDTRNATRAMRQLSRLSAAFDQRLNMLVNIILNTFFFYDLHVLSALERWKDRNKTAFPVWMNAVGEIETLNSLATFAYNNPEFIYPEPIGGTAANPGETTAPLLFEATGLAHPMILATKRVSNDITIGKDERLILITGSNMSGKTTFLRTIGVNLLLGQCGAPVCAGSLRFTPMNLLTSLRISDSLQENTSYFMAELKKLQKIVHFLQTGAPALVLIDEILRGTNSEDKTFGSEMYIKKLLQYNALSFFATHDLLLGQLEETLAGSVSNYCFESIIEAGTLHFNYQLQKGVARNRNASFLMQQMEII